MREITATTKSGKTVTVTTNLSFDQALKVLEEIAPWNTFAKRLLTDWNTYGERIFAASKDWIVVLAQQHLDRKKTQKAVTLQATSKFFKNAKPNVGHLVFAELKIDNYALQLITDTSKEGKKELVRVRRRRPDSGKDREYIGTIQPDGKFIATKATEEELKALKSFNQHPNFTSTVRFDKP